MMVDPQRLPHAARPSRRRRARRWRAEGVGAISRRAISAIATIATSIGSSGAIATAIVSAVRAADEGREAAACSAGDRQVDQPRPVDVGARRISRCWRRSYQPWPSSRARTCIIRILSSVSPSAKPWIPPQRSHDQPGGDAEPEQRTTSASAGPATRTAPPLTRHRRFFSFQPRRGALVAAGQRASGRTGGGAQIMN